MNYNITIFIFKKALCDEEELLCATGYGCIAEAHQCDSIPQCLDGSDEDGCGTYDMMSNHYRYFNTILLCTTAIGRK